MENNFKRFLSLLLAFVMVFGMMPANVFAVESGADESVVPNADPEAIYVAQIGDQGYETLAAAIAAASAGSTIMLIGDVTEDVTVKKDLTIDGAGKNYTGNISVNGSTVDIVVKNVNFVNGTGYAITTNSIASVTVEDCTVKDYGYGFLYANKSTPTIKVKNVTVDGCNYGVHWVYGSTATFDNVTMTDVAIGIYVQNYASKTLNLTNCNIHAENPIKIWERTGYSGVQTIKIGQGNNFGGADMDYGAYAKVVGAEVLCDNVIYASYAEAYAAAENGSVLKLVADLDVNAPIVIEKNISLDLNGKTITGLENVYPVVRIQNDADVTVLDSKSDADVAALDSENEGGSIVNETDYIFVLGASDGSSKGNLTIENGTFKGATTVASVTKGELIIKGGSFEVVDDTTYLLNCIDANYRDGSAKISVQGGTFKGFDPMNNAAEGAGTNFCAVGYESVDNGDGTWTVKKPAYVAKIGDKGYATLADAIAAVQNGETIVLLKDCAEDVTITQTAGLSFTIDGNNNVYSGTVTIDGNKRYSGAETLTIQNFSFYTDEKDHVFINANNAPNGTRITYAHNVTVENSTFSVSEGTTGVQGMKVRQGNKITFTGCTATNVMYLVQDTSGTIYLTVKDSTITADYGIRVNNGNNSLIQNVTLNTSNVGIIYDGGQTRTATLENVTITGEGTPIRLIKATAGTQKLVMKGNNNIDGNWFEIEGTGATIVVDLTDDVNLDIAKVTYDKSYYTVESVDKVHTFTKMTAVAQIGDKGYETLAAAIAAVQNGETIVLLKDCAEDVTIKQVANLSFTIDGNDNVYSGTVTIDGNKRYTSAEKLTFQNVKFATEETAHTFVYSGSKDTCQAHNVTFDGCSFTGPEGVNNVMGMNARQSNGITFTNCVAENVMYLFQSNSAGINLTVEDCDIDATYGIRVHNGDNAVIRNVKLNTSMSGIIFDGGQTRTATLENVTITGEGTPIYLNNATAGTQKLVMKGTNNIDGNWFKISGTGATIVVDLTDDANLDIAKVTYDKSYYIIESEEKVHTFTKFTAVAQIGEQGYATLADAIAAAVSGDTITLLADINETVTVDKKVTIEGAGFSYTGMMKVNSGLTVTVQNVNFVNGCIDKVKGTKGTLTVKNCTFDGTSSNYYYAITMRSGDKVVVDGCQSKGFVYGFLYTPNYVTNVSVKNVAVTECDLGINVTYGNKVNLENVTMTNVGYGIQSHNYGAKTFTMTNCDISGENAILVWERTENAVVDTFVFQGTGNKLTGEVVMNGHGNLKLADIDATLTAPEGLTVTTDAGEDYKVIYEEGVYKVAPAVYVAEVNGVKYETIQAAVDAAQSGQTVILIDDVTMTEADRVASTSDNVMVYVADKDITLDMNGKTISLVHEDTFAADYIVAVIEVADGAGLTVTGNGTIDVNAYDGEYSMADIAYTFFKRGITGHLTIENGTYHMDNSADSMIYTHGDRVVTVKGGTFILDTVGTGNNECPWIFNTKGKNENSIVVTGGTYNSDVSDQYWSGEVHIPDGYICEQIADDRWEVHAGSWTAEIQDAEGNRIKGYKSFEAAIAAVQDGQTIVLLTDCDEDVTIKQQKNLSFTIDGEGKNYTGTISIDGSRGSKNTETLTIQNVNFVMEDDRQVAIGALEDTYVHNLIVDGCTFTGDDASQYGIVLRHSYNITVKNSEGTKLTDLIYGNKAVTGLTVENVSVSNSVQGVWLAYPTGDILFQNVNISTTSNAGVGFYNRAKATVTFTDCNIDNIAYSEKTTNPMTMIFNDQDNILSTGTSYTTLTAVLNQVDATLTAVEDLTVISGVEGYFVAYKDGVHYLVQAIAQNTNSGKIYGDLSDALDEADKAENDDAQTVILLAETSEDLLLVGAYVTLDLNGHVVTAKNALSFGVVMDTASEVGGIKISNKTTEAFTKLQPENGGYLPIYDTNDGMYKFFKHTVQAYDVKSAGSGAVKFRFRILFENAEGYNVLGNNTNSVDYVLHMKWTGMETYEIRYRVTNVDLETYAKGAYSQMIDPNKAKNTKIMYVTVHNVDTLGSGAYISATPSVETVTEVVGIGDTLTYTNP